MDTKSLIAESKARFNHNSAKAQLKDKYESKLLIADQGGLWKADIQTISFLNSLDQEFVALIDTFDNPVHVNRQALLDLLRTTYNKVMGEWMNELTEVINKR